MMADTSTPSAPPYISFRTFTNFLDRLAEGGIPQHIDRHYWSGFLAGGLGGQVMVAFRWLGLIDPATSEPTPELEALVDLSARKQALERLLRERYGPIFEVVDLSRTTPGHLDDAFRKQYPVKSETLRKVVAFFVNAAVAAEIPLSTLLTNKTRKGSGPPARGGPPRPSPRRQPQDDGDGKPKGKPPHQPPPPPAGDTKTIKLPHGSATLIVSMNWIDADPPEREYVLRLIDTLNQWGRELPGGDASRREELDGEVHP